MAHFTQEQYKAAHDVSALEYAKAHGYDLVAAGNRYHLRTHDSMVFLHDGRWYWNSQGHSGRALEMLIYYEGRSLVDAVLELAGETAYHTMSSAVSRPPTPPTSRQIPFVLPPASPLAIGTLMKYLIGRRGCDPEIIHNLILEKKIYISCMEKNGYTIRNAIFVGYDAAGVAKSATVRGINYGSTYKGAIPGSDKHIPFSLPAAEGATTLAVFEAPIDAISHATIDKNAGCVWTETQRIALGGNPAPKTIEEWLLLHPYITTIELCLDNDDGGRKMDARLREHIAAFGFHGAVTTILPPSGKDWNEALTMSKSEREVKKDGSNLDGASLRHQFPQR